MAPQKLSVLDMLRRAPTRPVSSRPAPAPSSNKRGIEDDAFAVASDDELPPPSKRVRRPAASDSKSKGEGPGDMGEGNMPVESGESSEGVAELPTQQEIEQLADLDDPEECGDILSGLTLPLSTELDFSGVDCPIYKGMCRKMFADLQFKGSVKYLHVNGIANVWRFIQGMIASNPGLRVVVVQCRWRDIAALRAIGGDCDKVPDGGWYAGFVTDEADPEYLKMYIGQAESVSQRRRGHRNQQKSRPNSTVFYRISSGAGRQQDFVLLGTWSNTIGLPKEDPLLDIVEMYFSLLFQTLPTRSLEKWLPEAAIVPRRPEIGLNVSLPLWQSVSKDGARRAKMEGSLLMASSDPEIRDFARAHLAEASAKGRATMAAGNWVANSQGWRKKSWKSEVTRGPLPESAREKHVLIECSKCGLQKEDPDPQYETATGNYVVRNQCCDGCPPKKVNAKTGGVTRANPLFHPVDGRAWINSQKIKKPTE